MIDIPNLKIDRDGEDPDTNVMLEQDNGAGTIHSVYLHPIQVRLLAERMGILAPSSNIEADRTIARLCRQLRLLADRIDRLDTMMLDIGAKGRECVDEECAFSAASWELASEFVRQAEELQRGMEPSAPAASAAPAPANTKQRRSPQAGQLPLDGGP